MIEDLRERLRQTLTGREITVTVSHADEKRLRMYVDRMNADEERGGYTLAPQDVDDDSVLEAALMACMDAGMVEDETDHGLVSFPWGDVVSREQADEMARRGE